MRELFKAANARWRSIVFAGLAIGVGACGSTEEYVAQLGNPDPEVRRDASLKLLLRGERAVPPLLETLANGPDSVRFIAVQLLGKIGDQRATIPLARLLREAPAKDMREEAAEALGKLGDDKAIGPLRAALAADPAPRVRVEALRGLVNLRYDGAAEDLVKALDDWFPPVRKEALVGLVRLQYEELDPHLLRLVKDPDATVRYIAVQLLGRQGGAEAIGLLIEGLEDESRGVREEAALALGKLNAVEAQSALIDLMTRSQDADGAAAQRALKMITGVDYHVEE